MGELELRNALHVERCKDANWDGIVPLGNRSTMASRTGATKEAELL